jgi:aminoglycoside phosphotransferase (APT) family kinase protein
VLHADDLDLTLRDDALPGLSLILDEHRMRTELDALVPKGVQRLATTSIRYKPGMSCVVGLELVIDGAKTLGSAQLFGPAQREKFIKHRTLALQPSHRGMGMLVLADAPIVAWIWPGDSEVVGLRGLDRTARRRSLVASCLGETFAAEAFELRTLRYKPHRRWTARVEVSGQPHSVLKVYSPEQFVCAHRRALTAVAVPALAVPCVIGSSARHGAMALRWVPGEPLDMRIAAGTAQDRDLRRAAQTLAALHETPVDAGRDLSPYSVPHRLDAATRAIGALAPHLQPLVEDASKCISEELLDLPVQIIHGDCSADQVLIDNGTVSLIDWDRMALGPAAIDLGRFAGTLMIVDLLEGTDRAAEVMQSFIGAYCGAASIDPRPHLRAATALAVLELACEPFRNRVAGWGALLARAVRLSWESCNAPIHNA